MGCKFKFEKYGDKASLLKEIETQVSANGGTFTGDENDGEFYGDAPVEYKVKYKFDEFDHLNLVVIKKPFYLTCSVIEKAIEKYLNDRKFENLTILLEESEMEVSKLSYDIGNGKEEYEWEITSPEEVDCECEAPRIFRDSKYGTTVKIKLVDLGRIIQGKTESCLACTNTPLGRICTTVLCFYRRTCEQKAMLEVFYPGNIEAEFKKAMDECAKVALVPAMALIIAGQYQAAIPVFLAAFQKCLVAKGYQEATKVSVNIYMDESDCTSWRKI
ncbi:MAG TPA: hypothetical protein ENJ28_03080 [Gammaproteobacteria bacterium]|nr:hypothetical protein [Gammaproteobacteria bacterium]